MKTKSQFIPAQLFFLAETFNRFERHLRAAARNTSDQGAYLALSNVADAAEDIAIDLIAAAAQEGGGGA